MIRSTRFDEGDGTGERAAIAASDRGSESVRVGQLHVGRHYARSTSGPRLDALAMSHPTLLNGYRLWLDIQAVQTTHYAERGIARFVAEHAKALIEANAPVAGLGLNPARPRPPMLSPELSDATLLCWATASEHRARSDRAPLIHHVLSPYEDQPPARLFPSYLAPDDRLIATVYDLIPDVFPDRYLSDPMTRTTFERRRRSLEGCDLLLCISEHTRRDVVQIFDVEPRHVHVIGAGASPFFCPAETDDDVAAAARRHVPGLHKPYVLSVTGDEWRKNTGLLFRAFAALPSATRAQHQLVVVCSLTHDARRRWESEIAAAGLGQGDVVLTGRVEDEALRDLYRGASLFAFPSRYEGFGLPVVEAARCDIPVIVARASSLPALLEEPAAEFDPDDAEGLADLIDRALADAELRATLRVAASRTAAAHTWEHVAERTLAAYESLGSPGRHRRRQPRLAIVGPFPDAQSGVAVYNAKVVGALAGRATVDCYVEAGEDARRHLPAADRVLPVELFGAHRPPTDYDAVVFTIGNSAYHERTVELATTYPGVVWLHDVSLAGLAVFRAHRAGDVEAATEAMADLLADVYGVEQIPPVLLHEAALDPTAFARAAVRFAAHATRRARHVLVGSHLAAHEVVFDLGGNATPPITVVPLAAPAPEPTRTQPEGAPVVVSLGVVGPIKRPDAIVEALALLATDDAVLRFVGPCEDVIAEELTGVARAAGVADRVEVTGWVDAARYFDEIRSATAVVQLRAHSHGESSAAVLDALACGVPVVTSVASCSELPSDAVTMVNQHAPPAEIAAAIDELLRDSGRRERAAKAGLDYAASWGIDAVAEALLRVVDRLT